MNSVNLRVYTLTPEAEGLLYKHAQEAGMLPNLFLSKIIHEWIYYDYLDGLNKAPQPEIVAKLLNRIVSLESEIENIHVMLDESFS